MSKEFWETIGGLGSGLFILAWIFGGDIIYYFHERTVQTERTKRAKEAKSSGHQSGG